MTWFALYIHSEPTELDQIDFNLYMIAQVDPVFFSHVSSIELQDLWIGVLRGKLKNCIWMLLKIYTGLLHIKNAFKSVFKKSLDNGYIEFSLLDKVKLI